MRLGTSGSTSWSMAVFRVSGVGVQQRILRAIRDVNRPGVVALGATSELQQYVLVASGLADEAWVHRVVLVFDSHAVRSYSSRETHHHDSASLAEPR